MYWWSKLPAFTSSLQQGQTVRLNENWPGFQYLQREYGRNFPATVKEVHDDVIVIGKTRFARQVLSTG